MRKCFPPSPTSMIPYYLFPKIMLIAAVPSLTFIMLLYVLAVISLNSNDELIRIHSNVKVKYCGTYSTQISTKSCFSALNSKLYLTKIKNYHTLPVGFFYT